MSNKELIKKKFSKSLATYEKNAIVQKQMAESLMLNLTKSKDFLDCRVTKPCFVPRNDAKDFSISQNIPPLNKAELENFKDDSIAGNPALQDDEAIQGKYDKILEIGCGSGILTRLILKNFNFNEFFVNDMSEDSLNHVKSFQIFTPHPASSDLFSLAPLRQQGHSSRPSTVPFVPQGAKRQLKFLCGDCENISFPSDLDLVISNAAFQWAEDFPSLINKIYSSLKPQAILAFTTFGEQNFHQIKAITGKALNCYDQKTIENILSKNFKIIYSNSKIVNLEFNSAYEVLKHLKLCGVNALEQTKWTKKDLNNFVVKYNDFTTPNGKFILTYQPMYFIAQNLI